MSRLFQGASGGSVTMSQVLRLGASNFYELAYLFWGGGLVSDWWLKLDNHHKLEVNQDTYISQHIQVEKIKFYFWQSSRVFCPKGQTARECQQTLETHTHKQEDFILS